MSDSLASVYPLPPFYEEYTDENVKKIKYSLKNGLPVPKDLVHLLPPDPPDLLPTNKEEFENDNIKIDKDDQNLDNNNNNDNNENKNITYSSFGMQWNVRETLPALKDVGIPQLYGEEDNLLTSDNNNTDNALSKPKSKLNIKYLHKLNKSLLLCFLELIGILGIAPDQFPSKVEDIRIILINMHHLINEYRPHQARESLIVLMENKLNQCKKETEEINNACDKAENLINSYNELYGKNSIDKNNTLSHTDTDSDDENENENSLDKMEIDLDPYADDSNNDTITHNSTIDNVINDNDNETSTLIKNPWDILKSAGLL